MKIPWTDGNFISAYPNLIKCRLKEGMLTLLSGSKFYIPNGRDANNKPVFTEYTVTTDKRWEGTSYTGSDTDFIYFFVRPSGVNGGFHTKYYRNLCMGSTADLTGITSGTSVLWWDTTNNLFKLSTDVGSTWDVTYDYTLPVGVASLKQNYGVTNFIPFNFVGCMGTNVYLMPDVTLNFPNGVNTDGSGKSTATNSVWLMTNETQSNNVTNGGIFTNGTSTLDIWWNSQIFNQDTQPTSTDNYVKWYDTLNNVRQMKSNGTWGGG